MKKCLLDCKCKSWTRGESIGATECDGAAFLMRSRAALAIHIMFYPHSGHFPYEKFLFLGRRKETKRKKQWRSSSSRTCSVDKCAHHEEHAQRVCFSIKSLVVRTQRRKATCYRSSCSAKCSEGRDFDGIKASGDLLSSRAVEARTRVVKLLCRPSNRFSWGTHMRLSR